MNPNAEEFSPSKPKGHKNKKKEIAVQLSTQPTNAWSNPLKSVHVVKLPKQQSKLDFDFSVHQNASSYHDQFKVKPGNNGNQIYVLDQKPRVLPAPVKTESKFTLSLKFKILNCCTLKLEIRLFYYRF